MLNKNFLAAFLRSINSSKSYTGTTCAGNSLTLSYNLTDIFNRSLSTSKSGSMTNTHYLGLRFGTGTADESYNDICLALDPTQTIIENNPST